MHTGNTSVEQAVALRTEGVDRNINVDKDKSASIESPSARRAWIEILHLPRKAHRSHVALRTEGVDRNLFFDLAQLICELGRPPHGGRG